MRILLHVCCGPCAAFPVKFLVGEGHQITGFFYNPNIHPYKEFTKRLETSKEFAAKSGIELLIDDSYTLEEFLTSALKSSCRCSYCYEVRLKRTARYAKEQGYDCFSTSLLVSPYQKHEMITNLAQKVAEEEQIPFFYVDFREGWSEGVQISKELELYRQPYCGCIFSEKERYHRPQGRKANA